MSDNKKKKEQVTIEGLLDKLTVESQKPKININQIANVFGNYKDIKGLKKETLKELFDKAVDAAKDDGWIFVYEIYSRFYYRDKVKYFDEIVFLIKSFIEPIISQAIEINELNHLISNIASQECSGKIKQLWETIDESINENNSAKILSLWYLYLIIKVKEIYRSDFQKILNVALRSFLSFFGKEDKLDPLCVKELKGFDGKEKYIHKFFNLTFLFEGTDVEINELKTTITENREIISAKIYEIKQLNSEVETLQKLVADKTETIENNLKEIEQLKQDVSKSDNRNDYDRNLYEQKFISLKRNLVEKLKKDLRLEIEGLEDIAETLTDIQREKIQRRIARIDKILQKVGE